MTPGDSPHRPRVALVHGLWMGRWAMRPLARHLEGADLATAGFGYSTRDTPATAADRLAGWLVDHDVRHFVAHSLGGLVLAHLVDRHPQALRDDSRIVLLGSPLAGSEAARRLGKSRLGRGLLAGSLVEGLAGGAPPWRAPNTLMIAGTRPIGPGRLVPGALDAPSDGTVAVAETLVPGLAEHACLPVNHFGLLLSRQVAKRVIDHLTLAPG